jgi:hypothetical protein
MMELGIVKGSEIKKNKDSTTNRLLLQVEFIEESGDIRGDIRTVELIPQAGEDINPAKNSRVVVIEVAKGYQVAIATTDNLVPESGAGEKEIYSTDSPATEKRAKIKLSINGDIEIDAYSGANLKIKADGKIINNDGSKEAARKEDATLTDATTDNVFITWINQVSGFINGLAPGTITVIPTTVTGKINDGTDKVLLP